MDYKSSIEAGLDAAKKAHDARKEIETVIENLSEALSEYDIKISKVEEVESNKLAEIMNPFAPKKCKEYIAASKGGARKLLAAWTQTSKGYPCSLTYDNNTYSCHNKEALEKNLADMMANPVVGEKIFYLIRLKRSKS